MTNNIARKFTTLSLVLALGLTPALSYAKNNDNKNKQAREDKQEEKQERKEERKEKKEKKNDKSCLRAFGHLFAPGFIKNWGAREFQSDCFLPFGIAKKFRGVSTTTPPVVDTVAPIISTVAVNPNTTKATVTWRTDERSDSTVFWSTSSAINLSSASSTTNSSRVREHSLKIEGLTASTTYYFVVRSTDASSNSATSSVMSFHTDLLPTDTAAPVISSVSLLVSTSSINVSWSTNENSTSKLYYGTSSALNVNATSTSFLENLTLTTNHFLTLSPLASSTTYYMAIESKDGSGNRTVTPTFTTTTSSL